MNKLIIGKKINEGNYTVLHECNFRGKECAVKITKNTTHYVSLKFQFDAMLSLQNSLNSSAFRIPIPYDYFIFEKDKKEALVMEHINDLLPLLFVLQNVLCDPNEIIEKLAHAISVLHDYDISGYDTEFFWSLAEEKIVVIDLGPRYTINCDTAEMLKQHINLMREVPWGVQNIAGDIIPEEKLKAIPHSEIKITVNNMPESELLDCLFSDSISKHITDVAKMHYVQIIGCFPPKKREKMMSLFIDTYSRNACYNSIYLDSFMEAQRYNSCEHTAFLYYPAAKTASRMGCSIENDVQLNEYNGEY
jgi:hypothetical protein